MELSILQLLHRLHYCCPQFCFVPPCPGTLHPGIEYIFSCFFRIGAKYTLTYLSVVDQVTTRRLSILFIANLALADSVLPLVTSLFTPVLVTIHGGPGGQTSDHNTRSLTCRAVQGLMSSIMAVAVVSLGINMTQHREYVSLTKCVLSSCGSGSICEHPPGNEVQHHHEGAQRLEDHPGGLDILLLHGGHCLCLNKPDRKS